MLQNPAAAGNAVANTWPGMTLIQSTALVGLVGGLLAVTGRILVWDQQFYKQQPGLAAAIIGSSLLVIMCFVTGPEAWRRYRQWQRDKIALTDNPGSGQKYFRLDPYVTTNPAEFHREDNAHHEVLQWIRDAARTVLFLSGVSGSGKSSVLQGCVIPALRAEGWKVELIRSFSDPLPQLEAALAAPRRKGTRILIVFDQFEEFIVLEERTSAAERQRFLARVRELGQAPRAGVCLLFAFRRDYMTGVSAMAIGELLVGQSLILVDAFKRDAARRFLEASPGQKPGPDLIDRLLAGAEALDYVPARFRPITLNMLGLALEDFDRQMTGRPERLVQSYMERAINQPEIREIAPAVVGKMITDANTKEPRALEELAMAAGLSRHDVLVCLTLLAQKGLVRLLDQQQALWEISHDFVARQFATLLGRLQPRVWPRIVLVNVSVLFVALLLGVTFWLPEHARKNRDAWADALAALNSSEYHANARVDSKTQEVRVTFDQDTTDDTVKKALPLLRVVAVSELDLDQAQITKPPSLQGLTNLQSLDLRGTVITAPPSLQGLTNLQSLDLRDDTGITAPPSLHGLTNLQSLDLSYDTSLTTPPSLQGLTSARMIRP